MSSSITHLRQLEAESIHILREVVAEFDAPVMLYSIGKDSSVMVRLAPGILTRLRALGVVLWFVFVVFLGCRTAGLCLGQRWRSRLMTLPMSLRGSWSR